MTRQEYLKNIAEFIQKANRATQKDPNTSLADKQEIDRTTQNVVNYILDYDKNQKVYTVDEMKRIEKEDMGR